MHASSNRNSKWRLLLDLVRSSPEFTIIGFQNMTAWNLLVEFCTAKKSAHPQPYKCSTNAFSTPICIIVIIDVAVPSILLLHILGISESNIAPEININRILHQYLKSKFTVSWEQIRCRYLQTIWRKLVFKVQALI
jgi:hypothetical protein